MPTNITERGFEDAIEAHLLEVHGYVRRSPRGHYDKGLCLDRELVLKFVKETQPEAWERLVEHHGERVEEKFFDRLADELKTRGTLDLFRQGFKDNGSHFDLVYFEPRTTLNPESIARHGANVFSVIRQLKYSERNENSLDMGLFLNGLPIFTLELKNQLTGQSFENALRQYRLDRDPRETLFTFKRCLAHFAVDTNNVFFSTKLAKAESVFMPFNKGMNGGAGNPINPTGFATGYFWGETLAPSSVLELIQRFLMVEVKEKIDVLGRQKNSETLIFPRYHQRDTVRRLVHDAETSGSGKNYLIQHSAGSGKSNTIAWTAHRLSELHDAADEKIFSSVLVVTDRRVLDKQLRDTITQFAQTRGVVKPITESSQELREALESGEKIIITTIHKFSVIVDTVEKLPGKRFAIIIDEAHSSQGGDTAAHVRDVLAAETLDEAARAEAREPESNQDIVNRKMRSRAVRHPNISYFAFTATPKQKTLELFGSKDADGSFRPFSLYSMRQAIEEGFILDTLTNYTAFDTYFRLNKAVADDPEYDKGKAQSLLLNYVSRSDHAIERKVSIIIEHFRDHVADLIGNEAKAMIVTRSRLHAVHFKLEMDKRLRELNLPYRALVAFTGKVKDGTKEYTEPNMNEFPESQTVQEFKKTDSRFLIVAEKYQTGFDEPLLTAMYVDKKLGGVNAVQTLSRLNRINRGKDMVFVLDFVNEAEDIRESFEPYYTTTILSEATDPNVVHDLERDLLGFKLFSKEDTEAVTNLYYGQGTPAQVNSLLDEIIARYEANFLEEEKREIIDKSREYVKKYGFIAQIMAFDDADLERLFVFVKLLLKKLPVPKEPLPYDVLDKVDMSSYELKRKSETGVQLTADLGTLEPIKTGDKGHFESATDLLSSIIDDINQKYENKLKGNEKMVGELYSRLNDSKSLVGAIKNNSADAAKLKHDEEFQGQLMKMIDENMNFYQLLDRDHELRDYLKRKIFQALQKNVIEK